MDFIKNNPLIAIGVVGALILGVLYFLGTISVVKLVIFGLIALVLLVAVYVLKNKVWERYDKMNKPGGTQ